MRYPLREVTDAPKGTIFMKQAERRKISACLHPDHIQDPAAKKRYQEAFQLFEKLPIREISEQ